MNSILFIFCYVLLMIGIGGVVFYKCPVCYRYLLLVYAFVGLLGINFLLLSCNPFFYEKKEECHSNFLIYDIFKPKENN